MLFTSFSKSIICLLVCFLEIKNVHPQFPVLPPRNTNTDQIKSIAEEIRLFRFAFAQDQIMKLQDNSKIAQIIQAAYQNKEDNFGLILKFEDRLTRVDLAFHVLKALRNEMVANEHLDPINLIQLSKAFEYEVVHQKNNDQIIKAESLKIIEDIKIDVKNSATDILSQAMLTNNYLLNSKVDHVAKEIFNYLYSLNHEIMTEMVNRTYPFVPARDIISTIMSSSDYIPQKVAVILAVFEKLEKDKDLDNDAVLDIASSINIIRADDNYFNLFPNIKYEVNVLIDKLPTCARNLYLAEEVCLWNRAYGEYLNAVSPKATQDVGFALTTIPDALKSGQGAWSIEKYFDLIVFKSQFIKKHYLTVSWERDDVHPEAHYVQTLEIDVNSQDLRSNWKVELYGEYCFIKNHHINFDEYIFASDIKLNPREHLVLSAPANGKFDPINFQWQIRDCSTPRIF